MILICYLPLLLYSYQLYIQLKEKKNQKDEDLLDSEDEEEEGEYSDFINPSQTVIDHETVKKVKLR